METRNIDISNYWAPVVRNTAEFQQFAEAVNPELNALQADIHQIVQDAFVRDATEYGVGRWENMLNLTPEPGDTLDMRKDRILAYLSVKLPYTWRVLERMLIGMLGEGNVSVKLNNDTATLTVAVGIDTTESQLADIRTLLDRVLPRNLVTEFDPFPCDFERVEYLENRDGNTFVQIDNVYYIDEVELDISIIRKYGITSAIYGSLQNKYRQCVSIRDGVFTVCPGDSNTGEYTSKVNCIPGERVKIKANYKNVTYFIDGEQKALTRMFTIGKENNDIPQRTPYMDLLMKIYGAKLVWGENEISLVPALDPTGTPCMFDTMTRTPFYNAGTGDFLYPGAEQAVQTTDLDAKSYAKLTEHGIRRLYHVPKGYTGTMDEYAEANGFKELVEPPMPQTGYWMPEWRETETQLICNWVETEPPTEEVTENE